MERNPTTYAEWVVLLNQIKEGTCNSELLTRARMVVIIIKQRLWADG